MKKTASPTNLRRSSHRESPAPFFSIFYRGLAKGNRSQDHIDRSGATDIKLSAKTERAHEDIEPRKKSAKDEATSSSKFSQKPPLPRTTRTHSTEFDGGKRPHAVSKSTTDLFNGEYHSFQHIDQSPKQPYENGFHASAQHKSKTSLASAPASPTTSSKKWSIFGRLLDRRPSIPSNQSLDEVPVANGGTKQKQQYVLPPTALAPPKLSFTQRIKLHKGIRSGHIPVDVLKYTTRSHLVLNTGSENSPKKLKKSKGEKAQSVDGINELDPKFLAEALLAIGDEQPIVARSIPKHAVWSHEQERKAQVKLKQHCLFEQDVYDKMVNDAVTICNQLQSHLSDCIAGVRAKSPNVLSTPFTTPPGTPNLNLNRSTSSQPIYGGRTFSPPLFIQPPRVTIAVSNNTIPSNNTIFTDNDRPLNAMDSRLPRFPVSQRQHRFVETPPLPRFPIKHTAMIDR